MRIIRVFPRRTMWTPTDDYAFVGDPPLWRPAADEVHEVHVSVAFTWDVEEAQRLREAWAQYYEVVRIGGPAFGSSANGFEPGMYVKPGVTFTSRGCPYHCPWCLVWEKEGLLRLLEIKAGHILQDNNFLATPRWHQEQVYAMLKGQRRGAVFAGGLAAELVDDWVADQLRGLRIEAVFLAADRKESLNPLRRAVEKLSFLGRNSNRLRCYAMIGYGGESLGAAEARLEAVWEIGCMPFAQLYQPADRWIDYPQEWKRLARTWSRPAAMRALHKISAAEVE